MTMILLIREYEQLCLPVDARVETVQPGHAQDGVVTAEFRGEESQRFTIRADTNGGGREKTSGRLLASVGECDGFDESLLA